MRAKKLTFEGSVGRTSIKLLRPCKKDVALLFKMLSLLKFKAAFSINLANKARRARPQFETWSHGRGCALGRIGKF